MGSGMGVGTTLGRMGSELGAGKGDVSGISMGTPSRRTSRPKRDGHKRGSCSGRERGSCVFMNAASRCSGASVSVSIFPSLPFYFWFFDFTSKYTRALQRVKISFLPQ
jgi:hypothetical protein